MKTVLFADDNRSALHTMQKLLEQQIKGWRLLFAEGGEEALNLLHTEKVDALVTDAGMKGVSGLELLEMVSAGAFGFLPVVVITEGKDRSAKRKALQMGAQDLLTRPVDLEELLARLRSAVKLKTYHDALTERNARLENLVAARTEELAASRLELVVQLSRAAELRDHETGNHVLRVAMFSYLIAKEMDESEADCDELFLAATLHDVGKIAIPDAVLRKQGLLELDERRIIESHCAIGHQILANRDSIIKDFLPRSLKWGQQPQIMDLAAQIARSHHERWDGEGYPDGLKEDQIPFGARIVAVADVLDALRSKRAYKQEYIWPIAVDKIVAGRGTQFDPAVVDAFMEAQEKLRQFDIEARENERDLYDSAA